MKYAKKYADKDIVPKDTKFENALFWLQSGIDFESRRIHLDLDVGEVMASVITRGIIKMEELSNAPIEIFLSSNGGVAYDGLAIYDIIRQSNCDIIIYASGKIMSAAFIVFLAGDIRIASSHTTFMMHSVSYQPDSAKVRDHEIDVQEGKRINSLFLEIMASRTKRPKNWWYRKILTQDFYFNVNDAKEFGIVTDLSDLKQRKTNVRKKRTKVRRKKSTNRSNTLRKSRRNRDGISRRRKKVRNR